MKTWSLVGACVALLWSHTVCAAEPAATKPPAKSSAAAVPAASDPDPWPRVMESDKFTLKVYPPQVDAWDGTILEAHSAVAALPKGTENPLYGVVEFRARTAELLARRWHVLTLATLAGQLTVFGVLLASLRTLGVSGGEVSLIEAFAAWSLIRLLGSLPITPGGIGVIEVGLTTLLVGFGGSQAEVVAAVLVYRFLTIVPTLVLGLVLGPTIRRRPVMSTPEG